jgi:hypothetical protein
VTGIPAEPVTRNSAGRLCAHDYPAPGDDVPGAPPPLEGPGDPGPSGRAEPIGHAGPPAAPSEPQPAPAAPEPAPEPAPPESTAAARIRIAAAVIAGLALLAGALLARRRSRHAGPRYSPTADDRIHYPVT